MFFWVYLILIAFAGCTNENAFDNKEPAETLNVNQEELARAMALVEKFGNIVNPVTPTKGAPMEKMSIMLSEVKTLKNTGDITKSVGIADTVNLYTFQLEKEGKTGFAIACGDERIADVFAYVEEGSLSDTTYIKGMAQMIARIPDICMYQLDNCPANDAITKCAMGDYVEEGQSSYFDSFILLNTKWSQDIPYNWKTPSLNCTKRYYPAGCGVIAMAQIIAYYKKCDKNFDFDALTAQPKIFTHSDINLTNEVSEFIAYIGSLCSAEYSCEETLTYFTPCMSVFDRFGYEYEITSNKVYTNNYSKLKECIGKGNLVFAFGVDGGGEGHMWVIDGFLPLMTKCDANKVHCNWGWGGISNGWYTDDASNEDSYTHPDQQRYDFRYSNKYCYLKVNK